MERITDSVGTDPLFDDHLPAADHLRVAGVLAWLRVGFSGGVPCYVDALVVRGDAVKGSVAVRAGGPAGAGGLCPGLSHGTAAIRFAPAQERDLVHRRVVRGGSGGFDGIVYLERGARTFGGGDAGDLAGMVDWSAGPGADFERPGAGDRIGQVGGGETAVFSAGGGGRAHLAMDCHGDCRRWSCAGGIPDGEQRTGQRTALCKPWRRMFRRRAAGDSGCVLQLEADGVGGDGADAGGERSGHFPGVRVEPHAVSRSTPADRRIPGKRAALSA